MCRVQTALALLNLCLVELSVLLCPPCLFSIIPLISHLQHLPRMLLRREQSFSMTGQSFLCHRYSQARLFICKIRSLPPETNRASLSRCVRTVCLMSSGWKTGFLLDLVVFFALCIHRPHLFLIHRLHLHRHHLPLLLLCDVLHDFSLPLTPPCFTSLQLFTFPSLPSLNHVPLFVQLRRRYHQTLQDGTRGRRVPRLIHLYSIPRHRHGRRGLPFHR